MQDREYLLQCCRFMELNPVRARMVNDPAEYRWSSYSVNAFGVESTLRTVHPEYLALGDDESQFVNYRALFRAHVEESLAREIREVTDRGLALGDGRFVEEMERRTGRQFRPGWMGRPPGKERSEEIGKSRF